MLVESQDMCLHLTGNYKSLPSFIWMSEGVEPKSSVSYFYMIQAGSLCHNPACVKVPYTDTDWLVLCQVVKCTVNHYDIMMFTLFISLLIGN